MKLFLDTADVQAVHTWAQTGLIDGVTTNPTHLYKQGGDARAVVEKICAIMAEGDVSIEITESEPDAVYEQAKRIAAIAENVVVKIPCAREYYEIIKKLVDEDVSINITLVFSLQQALLMCKLGVQYISPFVGRLDDIDASGIELVRDVADMIDRYYFDTELLAASLRTVQNVHQVIQAGADVATVPLEVLEKMTKHPLTQQGMERFLSDWRKLGISRFP